jgi:nucleoside-diphosphate-sugar epimerase
LVIIQFAAAIEMSRETILITGATGFIGLSILHGLLRAGYQVKAVVRSDNRAQWLASRLQTMTDVPGAQRVEFVSVPNFVLPGAFDRAVAGVQYIVHVASPITSTDNEQDWQRDFVDTAVEGSVGLLEAAARTGTVKRIVITSSMVAMLPLATLFRGLPGSIPLDAESRSPNMQPPYPAKMMAYAAGKIAALNAAEAWVAEHQPSFDVIHVCPSFVTGYDRTATTASELCKGSNWHSLSIILGTTHEIGKPALTCHIDDVVRCHVQGLDPAVPGNQCYLVSCDGSEGLAWDAAKDVVRTQFPAEVANGLLPNNGSMPTTKVRLDVSKTEAAFGFEHIPFEHQVAEVVGQYLELLAVDKEQLGGAGGDGGGVGAR